MVAFLYDYGCHSQAIADTTVEEGLKHIADITRNLENFHWPSLVPFKCLLRLIEMAEVSILVSNVTQLKLQIVILIIQFVDLF